MSAGQRSSKRAASWPPCWFGSFKPTSGSQYLTREHELTTVSALRFVGVALLAVSCAACGTFQLASAVYPPAGKSTEQQQLDNLTCKDRAKLEANTAGKQAGAFLLGMTIVGAPVAYELEKSTQRDVYRSCMESIGYRVVAPDDGAKTTRTAAGPGFGPTLPEPPKTQPAQTGTAGQAIPIPAAGPATTITPPAPRGLGAQRDEAGQLEKLRELRDKGLITEAEYLKKRQDVLDRL